MYPTCEGLTHHVWLSFEQLLFENDHPSTLDTDLLNFFDLDTLIYLDTFSYPNAIYT